MEREINYVGIKLSDESKEEISRIMGFPEGHIYCDHMTCEFRPQKDSPILKWVKEHEEWTILLHVNSFGVDRNENGMVWAFGVDTIAPSKNEHKHITLMTTGTRKPVESNYIKDWNEFSGIGTLKGTVHVWYKKED